MGGVNYIVAQQQLTGRRQPLFAPGGELVLSAGSNVNILKRPASQLRRPESQRRRVSIRIVLGECSSVFEWRAKLGGLSKWLRLKKQSTQ